MTALTLVDLESARRNHNASNGTARVIDMRDFRAQRRYREDYEDNRIAKALGSRALITSAFARYLTMNNRMPCSISSGPQEPGECPYTNKATSDQFLNPDSAHDREMQERADRRAEARRQRADELNRELVRIGRWLNQAC